MIGTLCACLFALAALAASLAILLTVTDYAPDVAKLRRLHSRGVRPIQVSWRILAPTSPTSRDAVVRAACPAPSFPGFAPAARSLAA